MSSIPISFDADQQSKRSQHLPNLPRFNKQFIGIGHYLEQKRKQRRKIQQEERIIANRVLFLQKQQTRAQKSFDKKKFQLHIMIQTIDRKNQMMEHKQRLRQSKQIQLELIKQQNKHRRLIHKQIALSSKYQVEAAKHHDYSRIKHFIRQKEKEKKQFLHQDLQSKKQQWTSLNISKQKGKQKIDKFYKKKNKEHTMHYLSMIQTQQQKKYQKMHSIRQLEQYQTALKQRLQESTMKVSQMQQKIVKTSRTLEPRSQKSRITANPQNSRLSKLSSYLQKSIQTPANLSFQNEENSLSDRSGYLTQRNKVIHKDEVQIQQKITPYQQDMQMSGFKIIRTRKRKNPQDRYKVYEYM